MRAVKNILASVGAVLVLSLATATDAAPKRTGQIRVAYVPPKNPMHSPIHDRLKDRRVLEQLQQFLSPFRLPRPLTVKVEGCDGDSNAWYADDAVTVCYEYVAEIWRNAPEEPTAAGVTPMDALLGPLFDVFLHEFGHALFDLYNVPLFGREEDAADQVSAYIMLHLGRAEARRLILGTAAGYKVEVDKPTAPMSVTDFADEHGTPAQRLFNLLCIAYGADPKLFADVADKGYLPKERAEGCEEEYQQVAFAFGKLIAPHVDRVLAKKVHDRNWLPDATARVPGRTGTARTGNAK